jgi:hypothetical protein
MYQKKLTRWLIALIIWIGLLGFSGGARSLTDIEDAYRPYMADYPSLRTAITVFRLLVGAGVAVWAYTAWVLYRREPGTLARAQTCLVIGALLRVAGGYSIPLFGGFPPDVVTTLMKEALPLTLFVFLFTGLWYMYLARSEKVRDIYAAHEVGCREEVSDEVEGPS